MEIYLNNGKGCATMHSCVHALQEKRTVLEDIFVQKRIFGAGAIHLNFTYLPCQYPNRIIIFIG